MSLTRDEARSIIQRALELSKADATQVSVEANREANLRYANNEVSTSGDVSDVVITVRASFGKRSGAASVNQYDDASLTRAVRRAEETGSLMPPAHILNAPTRLMKDIGYGKGYAYDHDADEGFSGADYWPEEMERQSFYEPASRGFEARIAERLAYWDELRARSADHGGS